MQSNIKFFILIPTINLDKALNLVRYIKTKFFNYNLNFYIIFQTASTCYKVRKISNDITIIYIKNKSLTYARNTGLKYLKAENDINQESIIIFLDDDIYPTKSFFDILLKYFPYFDAATVYIYERSILHQYINSLLFRIKNKLRTIFFLDHFSIAEQYVNTFLNNISPLLPPKKPKRTNFIRGGVQIYKPFLLAFLKYDNNMIWWCYKEDTDISYKLSKIKSIRILLLPAIVIHKSSFKWNIYREIMSFVYYWYLVSKHILIREKKYLLKTLIYITYLWYLLFYLVFFVKNKKITLWKIKRLFKNYRELFNGRLLKKFNSYLNKVLT